MKRIKDAITLITIGLTLAFTVLVYAHTNFASKGTVKRIESFQERTDETIIKRLDRIDQKLDKILFKGE